MSLSVFILAAGQGKRMRSDLPKALHSLAGSTLLEHVYSTASSLKNEGLYIICGHDQAQFKACLPDFPVLWVQQTQQLGTGHAVQQALAAITTTTQNILILYADTPLISSKTLQRLIDAHTDAQTNLSLLTAHIDNPVGYGRVIRNDVGQVIGIVEERDATDKQRALNEVSTGILLADTVSLAGWLDRVDNNNEQREYYLTDIVAQAVCNSVHVNTVSADSAIEISGINNRVQLAAAERHYQLEQAHRLLNNGVGLSDPHRFDLRGQLKTGRDNTIDINVVLEGFLQFGHNVSVGPNCVIKDSIIGNNVIIFANCVIEGATIGDDCSIGPFARIRSDTLLDRQVHIGNFVELKKSKIGSKTKINHLSYIGDSELGSETNIGAGVITCNYDGVCKHKTIIGNRVFIGSAVQLIAPVNIGDGSTIAAGTTITKDVDLDTLAIGRVTQKVIPSWKGKKKR